MGIVVVSRYFPPSISGTPSVLHALLKKINPLSYTVVTRDIGYSEKKDDRNLECEMVKVKIPERIEKRPLFRMLYLPVYILDVFLSIVRTVSHRNAKVILSIFPDTTFLVMAYLANKIVRKPLVIYFHDTFVEQQRNPIHRAVATFFEKRILAMSTEVIVLNEALKALFRKKGIYAKIIRNTLDHSVNHPRMSESNNKENEAFRIVFTGSIYDMNLDAIKTAIEACKNLENHGIEFVISTPTSMSRLKKMGIDIERNQLKFFSEYSEYLQFLYQANLLFLPLSFNPPYPEETRTVLPQKAIDYMIAEVPILVLSPPEYYLSKYAQYKGFAHVVNTNSLDALQDAILLLKSDSTYRYKLVTQAKKTLKHHNPDMLARRLISIIRVAGKF